MSNTQTTRGDATAPTRGDATAPTPGDATAPTPSDEVLIGSTVSFTDRRDGREQTFRIVPPPEAEPRAGALSVDSPVGGALLHHRVGELVEVATPSGRRPLLITDVS